MISGMVTDLVQDFVPPVVCISPVDSIAITHREYLS